MWLRSLAKRFFCIAGNNIPRSEVCCHTIEMDGDVHRSLQAPCRMASIIDLIYSYIHIIIVYPLSLVQIGKVNTFIAANLVSFVRVFTGYLRFRTFTYLFSSLIFQFVSRDDPRPRPIRLFWTFSSFSTTTIMTEACGTKNVSMIVSFICGMAI